MKNPVIANHRGTPVVQFPVGWSEGWMHPEIENGQLPLYPAEAFIFQIAKQGWKNTHPFEKLPTTASGWRDWRESYYLGLCCSPFGYEAGVSHAPWGMSKHGVPKLRPQDE
jgi:hypothetical protein